MPYDLAYRNSGFYLTHRGYITIREINEVNGVIHGHREFDTHRFQLIHLLNADFSGIKPKDAKLPGATDSAAAKTRGNVKVAIVVTDKQAISFCENYIETARRFGSDWSFRIFSELHAAERWIGI